MGAKATRQKWQNRRNPGNGGKGTRFKPRCRRSVSDQSGFFEHTMVELPDELISQLPPALSGIDLSHDMTSNSTDLVNSVTGIFLLIQLMISGHPKAKSYLSEICLSLYPSEYLEVI